jgi:hypothetical protein
VLESEIVNNEEKAPKTRDFKTAFIIYNDGEFLEQKMVNLGSSKGKQGVYYLTISPETEDTVFSLNYKNHVYKTFHLKKCSSKELHLQQVEIADTSINSFWTLKTLPKPHKWY